MLSLWTSSLTNFATLLEEVAKLAKSCSSLSVASLMSIADVGHSSMLMQAFHAVGVCSHKLPTSKAHCSGSVSEKIGSNLRRCNCLCARNAAGVSSS